MPIEPGSFCFLSSGRIVAHSGSYNSDNNSSRVLIKRLFPVSRFYGHLPRTLIELNGSSMSALAFHEKAGRCQSVFCVVGDKVHLLAGLNAIA